MWLPRISDNNTSLCKANVLFLFYFLLYKRFYSKSNKQVNFSLLFPFKILKSRMRNSLATFYYLLVFPSSASKLSDAPSYQCQKTTYNMSKSFIRLLNYNTRSLFCQRQKKRTFRSGKAIRVFPFLLVFFILYFGIHIVLLLVV